MTCLFLSRCVAISLFCFCVNAKAADFWSDEIATAPEDRQEQLKFQKELVRVEQERKSLFDQVQVPTQTQLPNIDTTHMKGIDIQKLAQRYEQEVKVEVQQNNQIMVFVSFSMPIDSIKKAIQDVKKVDGVVVLRGFVNNNYMDTAKEIQKLGEQVGNIQVHPDAFKKYQVTSVPTVVLVEAQHEKIGDDGCALPDSYLSISGDVPLSYALEQFAKQGNEHQQRLATRYLRHLEH